MSKIQVDFNRYLGKIKPMHSVGQPPFVGMNFSMCDYLKKAHIPYSRLHDVGGAYGRNVFVDIPNIFRDSSADPYNPYSYDFAFTDVLIEELVKRDIEPFFRLGVTIENYSKIKAYHINPPEDYGKWAQICEGIIRHYTQGWANGFNYKITYWEIWNEPDNYEKSPSDSCTWTGTPKDFYRLYEVTSKHLKEKFPHLKIGGYSSCGFYAITQSNATFGACSPRYQNFMDFFDGFLSHIKEKNCPLDFFSWHSYSGIKENIIWTDYVRKRLDESGYTYTEHILNEWNSQASLKGTAKHAVISCGMMLALQNTTLNSAMFYDSRCGLGAYSGMFNCLTYEPFPAYYSFAAFGELYIRGEQVYTDFSLQDVYICAAKGEDGCIVISNVSDKDLDIELDIAGAENITECKVIKEDAVWQNFKFSGKLPKESVILLKYSLSL